LVKDKFNVKKIQIDVKLKTKLMIKLVEAYKK